MKRAALFLFAIVLTGCGVGGPPVFEPTVSEIARFETDLVTGVAVDAAGRVFVCFPRWHDQHHRLHVAEVLPSGNFAPYPSSEWNKRIGNVTADPATHFVCVQSVHVDDMDRLWVLDAGSPPSQGRIDGGPKLVQIDLTTNKVVRTIPFDRSIAPRGSYLNDVRIDTEHGFAFMSDSGLGAIVVVRLDDGSARRVLWEHASTKAEDIDINMHGALLRNGPTGQRPRIHCDGIALDAEGGWLYYQALTARTLYRMPTRVLMDFTINDEEFARWVQNLGETVVTDGMALDDAGNLYFTAIELDAIVVRTPGGEMLPLVKSPFLAWPDSIAISRFGDVYVTTSQIHLTPWFRVDGGFPDTPYRLFRMELYQGE